MTELSRDEVWAHASLTASAYTSLRRGHGRSWRCSEKVSRFPVPAVGETPYALAGQVFALVQDGIHLAGGFSFVVPGDRHQCVGHTESSM